MKPYKGYDINSIYTTIVNRAKSNFDEMLLEDALKNVVAAAEWAYNFNHIYTDPETEQLVKSISEATIETVELSNPNVNRCVLIDSFLWDNRGLSQQYFRAMMAHGMEILVVHTKAGGTIGKDILKEVQSYERSSVLTFPSEIDCFEQTREIVKFISVFAPASIFLHLYPSDVVALMACHAIKGSRIYNINLTDHAYWMGASFINYNLEFRPYGMTVSLEKRGLKQEQLLLLPYYPIAPLTSEFCGLPELPEGSVKIFTGGALYKMLGRNDIFFQIMDRVLGVSSNVYILVAGFNPNKQFDQKCSSMKYSDRVKQIGIRKDIDEVFRHIDIYLGTYPVSGGLMSQYAAKHYIPIIAYHEEGDTMNKVEEIVDCYGSEFKTFTDIDFMITYTSKLVFDIAFRKAQGKKIHDGMMNEERFKQEFSSLISEGKTSFLWQKDHINYTALFEHYLDLENKNGFIASRNLVAMLRWESISALKGYRRNMMAFLLKMVYNAIKGKLHVVLYKNMLSCIRKGRFLEII